MIVLNQVQYIYNGKRNISTIVVIQTLYTIQKIFFLW